MADTGSERKTIVVVGLGMVGIGESHGQRECRKSFLTGRFLAFIEKLLDLDTENRYRIVTCGEEVHRKGSSRLAIGCTHA